MIKKIFAVMIVLLALGLVLSCSGSGKEELRHSGKYIVKSTDGSGQVPLYWLNTDDIAIYIPDGAIVKIGSPASNIIGAEYEGNSYAIKREYLSEEEPESKAIRERNRKKNRANYMYGLILWCLVIAGFVVARKNNKKYAIDLFENYYSQKRKEFSWLDNYINQNGNPAQSRANSALGGTTIFMAIAFIVFTYILGFIANKFLFPSGFVYFLVSLVGVGIAYLASAKFSKWSIGEPATCSNQLHGLVLECPSCKCPHSWGMVAQKLVITDGVKTTRTKETWEEDSSGNRIFGSTKIKKTVDVKFFVDISRDFKCDNCGHTYHGEYSDIWYNSKPDEGFWTYDPPTYAWYPEKNK